MENVHLSRKVDSFRGDIENIIDSLIEEKEGGIEQLKSRIETLEEEING